EPVTSEGTQKEDNGSKPTGELQNQFKRGQPPPNKRRRVRGGSVTAASSSRASVSTIEEEAKEIVSFIDSVTDEVTTATSSEIINTHESHYDDEFDLEAFSTHFGILPMQSLVIIRPISGEDDDKILEALKPKYIVIYHPDQGIVRRVEVFRATHPGIACRVYFMMYQNSVEEQSYLSSIRREKESFERLIHEKSIMAIPL
ncbi:15357_t:CDS:1, partial [Acaulospora colombiana]